MSGPTVHFGSFDAELAWRPSRLARLPAGPMPESNRATRGMDELLAAGCASGDLLLTSEPVSNALVDVLAAAGISPVVRAVPGPASSAVEQRLAHVDPAALPGVNGWAASVYAVVPGTAAAVAALGLRASLPGVPDVARVNSKTWSNELVVRLGLPGAAVLATSPSAVRQYATLISERGVVLKDPYGVSGRGALRVGSGRVLDTVVRHLEWQVAKGDRVELLVQPWLDADVSFSTHGAVDAAGGFTWLGLRRVDNDGFAYRGSGPLPRRLGELLDGAEHRQLMVDLAAALVADGYVGPFCVDGLSLSDGTVVPLLEINARRSMGWLSLRLGRRAASVGLRSWLRCRQLAVFGSDPAGRLIAALDAGRCLFRGERPGVLPLTAGTLTPPRGRLFYAVFAVDDERMHVLDAALGDTIAGAGFDTTARPTPPDKC